VSGSATDAARAVVGWVAALVGAIGSHADAWVRSGDATLIVVLVGIALALLVAVVIPTRRRY
jgi:uncharacterized membrane protein YgaE (UPF0421/DUF939 family)